MKKRFLAMLLCIVLAVSVVPVGAWAADAGEITITKTDINADRVANTGGYGNLRINGKFSVEDMITPQAALVDSNGTLIFPYKETWHTYYYSDGIVSLVSGPYMRRYLNQLYDDDYGMITGIVDKIGFWNLNGSIAFPCEYFGASPMRDGYAFVTELTEADDGHMIFVGRLIDKKGTEHYTFESNIIGVGGWAYDEYETFDSASWYSDGLLLCWSHSTADDTWGELSTIYYKDFTGKAVLTLPIEKYSDAWPFSNGYAAVQSAETGSIGFINKNGKEIIPCMYEDAGAFNDDLTYAVLDGKYGYINAQNEIVIPFEYDAAYGAADGLAAVGKDGKFGLVDYKNNVIVPLEYDDISSYDEGVAYAIKDGYLYIITGYRAPQPQGDVDNDGKVANSDLIMVARYVVDIIDPSTKSSVETYGDMNGDGVITNADIITIARIIVGLD